MDLHLHRRFRDSCLILQFFVHLHLDYRWCRQRDRNVRELHLLCYRDLTGCCCCSSVPGGRLRPGRLLHPVGDLCDFRTHLFHRFKNRLHPLDHRVLVHRAHPFGCGKNYLIGAENDQPHQPQ